MSGFTGFYDSVAVNWNQSVGGENFVFAVQYNSLSVPIVHHKTLLLQLNPLTIYSSQLLSK